MDTKTLDRIRDLVKNGRELGTFWARWRKQCSEPGCDKHTAGFNQDSRFTSFKATLSFDSAFGFYGNSGCSTFLHCSHDIASEYLVKAVRAHQETIFQTMAEMMREDAADLTAKARTEIVQMQKMVDEIERPPPAVAA